MSSEWWEQSSLFSVFYVSDSVIIAMEIPDSLMTAVISMKGFCSGDSLWDWDVEGGQILLMLPENIPVVLKTESKSLIGTTQQEL